MKITNTSGSVLTFGYGDESESVLPGETSSDLKLKADDPFVNAYFNAGCITVTGRGAPRSDDPPATAVEQSAS